MDSAVLLVEDAPPQALTPGATVTATAVIAAVAGTAQEAMEPTADQPVTAAAAMEAADAVGEVAVATNPTGNAGVSSANRTS